MSRIKYRTVNLPEETVRWLDHNLPLAHNQFGVRSRDEFVRIAVAVLGSAMVRADKSDSTLDVFHSIIEELRRRK